MSPLRRWFHGHGMPGWYSWMVVVALTVLTGAGSILVCLRLAERSVQAERIARQEAAEQSRRRICVIVTAQDDAYSEPPGPATQTGKNAARAWREARMIYQCDQGK